MDCRIVPDQVGDGTLATTNVVPKNARAPCSCPPAISVADRRFRICARSAAEGRSRRRRRSACCRPPISRPAFISAWFTLGEIRERLGERDAAIAAFRKALVADPEDRHGASLRLMLLGAERLSAMPEAYVRVHCFDQYAPKFERHWSTTSAIAAPRCCSRPCWLAPAGGPQTGLLQARHRSRLRHRARCRRASSSEVDHFIGIDLSPRMIERARATGLYAQARGRQTWCRACAAGLTPAPISFSPPTPWSICPISRPLLGEVKRVLVTGGLLAFTVETHGGDGVVLGEGLRYAHSAGYARRSIGDAGLTLSHDARGISIGPQRERAVFRRMRWILTFPSRYVSKAGGMVKQS